MWVLSTVGMSWLGFVTEGQTLAAVKIVTLPGPQEYNEPAIWHTT